MKDQFDARFPLAHNRLESDYRMSCGLLCTVEGLHNSAACNGGLQAALLHSMATGAVKSLYGYIYPVDTFLY